MRQPPRLMVRSTMRKPGWRSMSRRTVSRATWRPSRNAAASATVVATATTSRPQPMPYTAPATIVSAAPGTKRSASTT